MTGHYVYILRDPLKDGAPFYVGKGKGRRVMAHLREAHKGVRSHKCSTIRKILEAGQEPVVQMVEAAVPEPQAFELEEFLIAEIGRADRGRGPLTNKTDGGDGFAGIDSPWWGRKHSEATRQKMSAWQKGLPKPEQAKASMRKPKSAAGRAAIAEARRTSTYRPSEKTRQLLSAALKGRPSPMRGRAHTEESKALIGAAQRGVPKPKVACPHCNKIGAMNVLSRWHFDNCKELAHV